MSDAGLSWDDLAHLPATRAAALLVQQLEADPPLADDALVERWIAESDENRIAWTEVRDAWDVFEGWDADPSIVRQRQEAIAHSFDAGRKRWRPLALAAASAAFLALGGTMIHVLGRTPRSGGTAQATTEQFGRADLIAGKTRRVFVLPDGTRAELAGGTVLDLAFTDTARLLRLERGEATFDVAKDGGRPFRVAVRNHVISDVGTVFTVRRDDDGMRVHLLKGSITVRRGDLDHPAATAGITMLPGQTLEANPQGERLMPYPTSRAAAPGAAERIVFRDVPLSAAVEQVNRTSDVKLEADPRVAGVRIRGSFRTGDGARFARALSELHPIEVRTRSDGTLVLSPRAGG